MLSWKGREFFQKELYMGVLFISALSMKFITVGVSALTVFLRHLLRLQKNL